MEQRHIIGISFKGHQLKVGPLIGVLVSYKPDFFRKFSFIKLNHPDKLSVPELNKTVELTQRYISFQATKIEASDLKTKNILELEQQHTIALLNSQYRFWEHKINIDISYDLSRAEYIEGLKLFLPTNLQHKDLKFSKWIIANNSPKKPCLLASCYAQYLLNIALNDIKSVWGECGTGFEGDSKTAEFIKLNPTCPSIRQGGNTNDTSKMHAVPEANRDIK